MTTQTRDASIVGTVQIISFHGIFTNLITTEMKAIYSPQNAVKLKNEQKSI